MMTTKHNNYLSKFRCGDSSDTISQTSIPLHENSWTDHKDRWNNISELAGSHRQDDSELTLAQRGGVPISPRVFQCGVPTGVAARVKRLHIFVAEGFLLPEWLDVLSSNCFELQHLQFSPPSEQREARIMRRLYILYRLPDLETIDGEVVTEVERQLARPDTPNGERVDRKEWVEDTTILNNDDDGDDTSDDDGADSNAEVSLFGLVKPVAADPSSVSFDEPDWELPYCPPEEQNSTNNQNSKQCTEDQLVLRTSRNKKTCLQGPLHALCTRNEKYLPCDEEDIFVASNNNQHRIIELTEPYPLKSSEEKIRSNNLDNDDDDIIKQSLEEDCVPLDKHERRRQRVLGRWRDRKQFRAMSMMDREYDSNDDENPDKIIVH